MCVVTHADLKATSGSGNPTRSRLSLACVVCDTVRASRSRFHEVYPEEGKGRNSDCVNSKGAATCSLHLFRTTLILI